MPVKVATHYFPTMMMVLLSVKCCQFVHFSLAQGDNSHKVPDPNIMVGVVGQSSQNQIHANQTGER